MFKPKLQSIFLVTLICLSPLCAKKHNREKVGQVIQVTIPVTGLLIAFSKDDTEGMKQLFYSVAASTAATWALKLTVRKKRPGNSKNRHSFPSGDTSLAFSGASFLGMRYGAAYGVPACGAASYVGYSRVQAKRHDWADVLCGGAIGALSGFLFTTPQLEKKQEKQTEVPELKDMTSLAEKK
jgi:membrane-associated phospholipid phosphatase